MHREAGMLLASLNRSYGLTCSVLGALAPTGHAQAATGLTTAYADNRERDSMVEPYTAVALSPRVSGCESRADYVRNISHINAFIDVAYGMAATDGPPVKLIVLPEGAFQSLLVGFKGGNRAAEARMALELPGPETALLGEKARELRRVHRWKRIHGSR